MIYVCDTHAFIWWATRRPALGRRAARIFARAERGVDEIRLPAVSVFEIALLLERGRLRTALGWDAWCSALRTTPGVAVEPIGLDDAAWAASLASLVDPFDRLIAAVARRLDVPLMTSDERIGASGLVPVVWA